MVLIQAFEGK